MVSLHMVLLLPAKPPLFLSQDDATNSCLAVSGASLMPPLRAPGAVLPLHSQISLLRLYYLTFLQKCLLSLGAPASVQLTLFGGGFLVSQ